MSQIYSGQKFKFEPLYLISILDYLSNNTDKNIKVQNVAEDFGIGVPKAKSLLQYLKIIESISDDLHLTNFGEKLIQLKNNDEFIYPLIYSKLCRGWGNGGHFYFSRLVNDIFYDTAFSSNNVISIEEVKERMLTFKPEIQVKEDDIKSLTRQALSSLANESDGFGKMGIVKEIEDNSVYVSFYEPHYLVAAYIIFDRWDECDTVFKFDTIVNGDYNLGRIFFMFEEDIFSIFERMKQNKFISIEVSGGLNQIAKNPRVTKEDILEEMVKYV